MLPQYLSQSFAYVFNLFLLRSFFKCINVYDRCLIFFPLQAIYDSLPYEKKNHDPKNTLYKVSAQYYMQNEFLKHKEIIYENNVISLCALRFVIN